MVAVAAAAAAGSVARGARGGSGAHRGEALPRVKTGLRAEGCSPALGLEPAGLDLCPLTFPFAGDHGERVGC